MAEDTLRRLELELHTVYELCQLLGINVNELLSGEHLIQDTYNGNTEENMMDLIKDN